MGASLAGLVLQAGVYVNLWRCFRLDSLGDFELDEHEPRLYTPAVRLSYGIAVNRAATKELDELVKAVERTEVEGCSFRSPLIVLVIGESYNKHHASLYNPRHRSTTPRLEALRDEGRLWVFSDVVTPYNHTTAVFREMFSTWDRSCTDGPLDHTLFPAVFRKAGYDVWLFSNQFVQKNADVTTEAKLNIVGGTIFNHSHLSALQFTRRNTDTKTYDGELLDMLPTADESRPTLLIVHLKGQHVDYGERYPEDRTRYRPEDYEARYGGRTEQEIHARANLTALLGDVEAGNLSLQGLHHVSGRRNHHIGVLHRGDGTCQVAFLLRTVTDNHHVVETQHVGLHGQVHRALSGLHRHRLVAGIRELQLLSGGSVHTKVAVDVGHHAAIGAQHSHCDTNHRFSRLIDHMTSNRLCLLYCVWSVRNGNTAFRPHGSGRQKR
jgi:hypothetical protein